MQDSECKVEEVTADEAMEMILRPRRGSGVKLLFLGVTQNGEQVPLGEICVTGRMGAMLAGTVLLAKLSEMMTTRGGGGGPVFESPSYQSGYDSGRSANHDSDYGSLRTVESYRHKPTRKTQPCNSKKSKVSKRGNHYHRRHRRASTQKKAQRRQHMKIFQPRGGGGRRR